MAKKKNEDKPISILEMTAIMERHNQKYGTDYTYGEFVDKVRRNKIVIRNGESFERNTPHPPQVVPLLPTEKALR